MARRRVPRLALLLALLLPAAALAGCAGGEEPDADEGASVDEPGTDAPGDEASEDEAPSGGTPSTPDAPAATPGERFRRAFDALREDDPSPGAFLMTMDGLPTQRPGARVVQWFYADPVANRTAYRFLHTDAGGNVSEDAMSGLVNDTLFEGAVNESLVAMYDPAAPDYAGYNEFQNVAARLPGFLTPYLAPSSLLMQAGILYAPPSTPTVAQAEEGGAPVERLTYASEKMRVTMQKDPSRILRIEKEAPRSGGGTVNVTIDFAYGDVRFPLLDTLVRAERLAPMDHANWTAAARGEFNDASSRNWTLQPSSGGARVALSEVELHVYGRGDLDRAPRATLSLEEGAKEDATFRLRFTDADGDGLVGAGDVVSVALVKPGTSSSGRVGGYDVRLHDERTGARLTLA